LLVVGLPVGWGYMEVMSLPEYGYDAHVGRARHAGLFVVHDAEPVRHLPVSPFSLGCHMLWFSSVVVDVSKSIAVAPRLIDLYIQLKIYI